MRKLCLCTVLLFVSISSWALNAPVLTSPGDTIVNAYTRQTFKWQSVSNSYYILEIDTTLLFNSPENRKTTTYSTQYAMRDFRFYTRYYWRVRAVADDNNEVMSDWSEIRTFKTLRTMTMTYADAPDEKGSYYTQQKLTWKNCYGCGTILEIDTVSTFDSPAKRRLTDSGFGESTTEGYISINNLYFNKMHYWRIKAYNENDSSAWTETRRFHTLARTSLTSPSDSASNLYTQLKLRFKYMRGVSQYQIQLDTVNTFDSPELQTILEPAGNEDAAYCSISKLLFGATYYWRIRMCQPNDTSLWTASRQFTTYNFAKLTSPSDSATNIITRPKLKFEYSTGISTYQMQLDTVRTFDSPALQNKMESASSSDYAYWNPSQLLFGQTYYWRMRECHAKDTSKWSAIRMFTTYNSAALSSPSDSLKNAYTQQNLYFRYTSGVSNYQLQIDTLATFDSPVLETRMESASSSDYAYCFVKNLFFGKNYYWRVRECTSVDTSKWSKTWMFTTVDYINLYSPSNGTTESAILPTLRWNYSKGCTKYIIELDTTLQFNSGLLWKKQFTSSETSPYYKLKSTDDGELLYGTKYYWRACAINENDTSGWSSVWNFTTIYQMPVPQLASPANQYKIVTEDVVNFSWNAVEGAEKYQLQMAYNGATFEDVIHQEYVTGTSTACTLPGDSLVYWRVRAVNAKGVSDWSQPWCVARLQKHTIIFKNEDGSVLQTIEVPYGETPTYNGETPTKPATAQYTYTFNGWDKNVDPVTGEATYVAVFTSTINVYTIVFKNEDGSVLQTIEVPYGETPTYSGQTPTKPATAQYTYTFKGWDKNVDPVTGEATYVAVFTSTVNVYTIVFKNEDGSVLQTIEVPYGETPTYNGETPTKPATAQYTYTFKGWDKNVDPVTGEAIYVAVFTSTVNVYTIVFKNEDGSVLQTIEVPYGETPTYNGETPTKPATAQYTYTFKGWDKNVDPVTGEAIYVAVFTSTVNVYTIVFKNEDGSVLQTIEVPYGETPTYSGETPTKPATAQYTYTFKGWDKNVDPVTGEATYVAVFTSTVNVYTIVFKNEDGSVLQTIEVPYGDTPSYSGQTPTKPATAQYTYTFKGWDKNVDPVTGEATYVAVFTSTVNVYTITIVQNENGEITGEGTYEYGSNVILTALPNEGYEFVMWSDGELANPRTIIVTGTATYEAIFDKIPSGTDDANGSQPKVQKFIRDGQLYIIQNGRIYNVNGMEVKE